MNQNSIILEEREEDSASILKTNSKINIIVPPIAPIIKGKYKL